jgi:alcohol dehydrogenase class IV
VIFRLFQIMQGFDFQPRTRVIFGNGALQGLGQLAREVGFRRTLLVADRGLVAAGYAEQTADLLRKSGIEVEAFTDFDVNPDSAVIETGCAVAAPLDVDSIVGLGGGSSLDCAKGINFLLTNGGRMQDYVGYGKAMKLMLPMIGIPTTAGTGSEAQSYSVISDAQTHVKMACGDPKAAFRACILDPTLTLSQPRTITATAGFDAITHAVETYVTTKRNPLSEVFSREAWALLEANYERVLAYPNDLDGRSAMQLGAYFAGVAIESSMLGATHACANPLTARYGTTHGAALAMLLPTVVRWNRPVAGARYAELARLSGLHSGSDKAQASESLAQRLEQLAAAGGLQNSLSAAGVKHDHLPVLAEEAAMQWTGGFNPRPFDLSGALEVYEWAY